jgi:predicted phage-related endonuclease
MQFSQDGKMNNYTFMHSGKNVRSLPGYYIGASEVPIILGLTKTTALELWRQKKGLEAGFQGNQFTEWGHLLEGTILYKAIKNDSDSKTAFKFLIDYTKNMFDRGPGWKPKTIYHPFTEARHNDLPWMIAHADCVKPDCYVPANENETAIGISISGKKAIALESFPAKIIEAKSGGRFANLRREDFDGYDPKDPTQSGLPIKVYVQVQWQQAVYGIQSASVAALIDTNNFMTFDVPGNQEIQGKLIEIGSRFMRCLKKDIPPTPKTFGDIDKLFPQINNNRLTIMGGKAVIAWDIKNKLKKARDKNKKIKSQIDDYTNALGLLIGENKELADEFGNKICGQSKYETGTMIHPSAIKKDCPEAYELLEKAGKIKNHEVRRIY